MTAYFKGSSYNEVGANTGSLTIDFTTAFFPASAIPEQHDFLVLAVQSANESVATPSGWSKFRQYDTSGTGTPGGIGSVKLSIFYRFCDDTLNTVTIADSGAQNIATLLVFKGVNTTNPITNAGTHSNIKVVSTPTTAVAFDQVGSDANNMILHILASGYNSNIAQFSSPTNSNLSSVTEVVDYNSTLGVGGGITAVTGVSTAGSWTGQTTGTLANASLQVLAVMNLNSATNYPIAAKSSNLKLTPNYGIVKSDKPGTRVSKLIESFDGTPLVGDLGTWVKSNSDTTVVNDTGGWKITANFMYNGYITSPYINLTAYDELSLEWSTFNTSGTTISVTLEAYTSAGASLGGTTIPLTSNSSGTSVFNINELLRNKSSLISSNVDYVTIRFYFSGSNVGASYIIVDNLNAIYNQQRLITADPLSLISNYPDTKVYYGKRLPISVSARTITTLAANLTYRKVLSSNTYNITIGSPNVNLKSTQLLPITSNSLSLTSVDNIMYRGVGLTASKLSLIQSSQQANLIKERKIVADTKPFILSFPDTNTVLYLPPEDFTISLVPPTLDIAEPPHLQIPTLELGVTLTASFYYFYTITFTGSPVPSTHVGDSKLLEADAYVDLFEIALAENAGTLYLKMNKTVEWQGNVYEGTGIQIEGVASFADDEVSRPKLSIWNPEGVFSYLVGQGTLEGAIVSRIRVLKFDIDNNLPVYRRERWKLSRVMSLKKPAIVCELRDMMDGQNFLTPGRMFIPPEFKTVSLS